MILGLGVDVVEVARLDRALARTPLLAERMFTPAERGLPLLSLAARFAAKEAAAKALGAPAGLAWQDVEIETDDAGAPHLRVLGTVRARAQQLGITRWHVSLSHDGGVAVAVVIAEGDDDGQVIAEGDDDGQVIAEGEDR